MHVAAIIAAGGRGVRFGADRPKQFLEIGGRSILELSVAALAASDRIQEIVVALPGGARRCRIEGAARRDRPADPVVAGGARRQDSVANAFAKTSKESDIILIHDAARPFVTRGVIDAPSMARKHTAPRSRRSACATPSSRPATRRPTARAWFARRFRATRYFSRRRRRRSAATSWRARSMREGRRGDRRSDARRAPRRAGARR